MSYYEQIVELAKTTLPPDVWELVSEKPDFNILDIDNLLRRKQVTTKKQFSALADYVCDKVIRLGRDLGIRRQFFLSRIKKGLTLERLASLGIISEARLMAIQVGDYDKLRKLEKRFLNNFFSISVFDDDSFILRSWDGCGLILYLSSLDDFDNDKEWWGYAVEHCERRFESNDCMGVSGTVIECDAWEVGLPYYGRSYIEVEELPSVLRTSGMFFCKIGESYCLVNKDDEKIFNMSGCEIEPDDISWALVVRQLNTEIKMEEEYWI